MNLRGTRTAAWLLSAIVALAAGLRFWAITYGLPAIFNPDEIPILSRALALAKGDLNPHNFLYPTLYFYELFAWEALYFVVARLAGTYQSLAAFQNAFFVDPSRLVLVGRTLTATFGVATVVAVYFAGRRLYDRNVGMAAALFLAVSPFAVRGSTKKNGHPVMKPATVPPAAASSIMDARRQSFVRSPCTIAATTNGTQMKSA
jgi:hypothetical protein